MSFSPCAPLTVVQPRDFLVIKPSSLGDVVHTLPAVALLKRHFPEARIRWLINPEWAPLLDGNPDVDEVILFPRREFRGLRGMLRILPWARRLRASARADCVLDFQGLLRSALIARLCRRRRVIGLSDAREGARHLYDEVVDVSHHRHAVDRYLALVAALGVKTSEPLDWPLPLGAPPRGFEVEGSFILLHPFSRGAGKSLSKEDIERFCRAAAPARVVIAGRADQQIAELPNALNLLNRTSLLELIWLLRRAAFVVSVDSGPMHIAAALTSKLVSLHTWSDPQKVGPYPPDAWVWQSEQLHQVRHLTDPARARLAPTIAHVATFSVSQIST